MGKLETQVATLNAELQKVQTNRFRTGGIADPKPVMATSAAVEQMSRQWRYAAQATGQYNVEQRTVISQGEHYTKLLKQQKLGLSDIRTGYQLIKKEQIALNRAMMVSAGTDASGRSKVDMFSPRTVGAMEKSVFSLQQRMGLYSSILGSVSAKTINWGKNTQWAGRQLTVGLSVPLLAVGAAAGTMAYQVDAGLTRIKKVYDTTAASVAGQTAELDRVASHSTEMATQAAKDYGASISDTLDVEAQLAATGRTRGALLQQTTQVMRVATLGEFDYNTALQASIALQSIFKMSTDELGKSFDYINAIENATSLSMQDFATAIPIAAGPVKQMGGDIKDLGLLLVAMKERGIAAAQGANAIKSAMQRLYRPSKQVQDEFAALTGQSLPKLVKESGGDVIKMLTSIADATKNLDRVSKIKALAGIFGTYQVTRLSAILNGLDDLKNGVGQVADAERIANQSSAQNHQIAEKELDRWRASISGKFKIAIQTIKAELAEIGPIFLEWGTAIINVISGVINWFNNLPGAVKKGALIATVFLAATGPLIMLAGLMGNLIGQAGKAIGVLGTLATRFKLLDREGVVASGMRKFAIDTDLAASATVGLTDQVRALTVAYEQSAVAAMELNAAAARAAGIGKYALPYSAAGEAAATSSGFIGPVGKYAATPTVDPNAVKSSTIVAEESEKASRNWSRMAGTTAMTGGIVGLMATDSGSMANNFFLGVTALGMFPKILEVAAVKAKALAIATQAAFAGSALGRGSSGFLAKSKLGISTVASGIAALGSAGVTAFAAIAVAAGVTWYEVGKDIDATRAKYQALNDSAQSYADILGFTYRDAATFTVPKEGNILSGGSDIAAQLLPQLEESMPEVVQKFVDLGENGGDVFGQALYEGMKARMHGASAKQAQDIVQTLMHAAGQEMGRHELEVKIAKTVDMKDVDSVVSNFANATVRQLPGAMQNAIRANGWEGIGRTFWGGDKLTTGSAEEVKGFMDNFYTALSGAAHTNNQKLEVQMVNELRNSFMGPWEKLFNEMKSTGGILEEGATLGDLMAGEGMTPQGQKIFGNRVNILRDAMKNITEGLKEANPRLGKFLEDDVKLIDALYRTGLVGQAAFLKIKTAIGQGGDIDYRAMAQGNNEAMAAMDGYGDAAGDAAPKIDKNTDAIKNNQNAMKAYNSISWKSTWQTVMTDAQQSIADSLMSKFDQRMQSAIDSVAAAWQKKLDQFDAMREKQEKEWDRKQEALDRRQENATEALTARYDKQRQAITNYYDNQTNHVNNAIEAEQRAEEIRQQIFDNEERRLQRLADMQNATIDFNVALNSGQLDEAAKIRNDQAAAEASNALEDAGDTSDAKSEKRLTHLNHILDKIEKLKQKKLDALDKLEAKEQKMLEREQRRQDAQLARERAHWEKMMDIREKALQAQADAAEAEAQKEWEARKETLQQQLDIFMQFIPRNEEQLRKHADRMRAMYNKFGGDLKISGKEWGHIVGDALHDNVAKAARGIKSDINWSHIGKETAKEFISGAFGMSLKQFQKFLGIQMHHKQKGGGSDGPLGNIPNPFGRGFHTGGEVGGNASMLRSAPFAQDEVPAVLKRGEYVVQESSVAKYGKGFMEDLNAGKVEGLGAKGKKGGRGPGLSGDAVGLGYEGVVAMMMARYMQGASQTFATNIMQNAPGQFGPGHAGHYGDMDFDKAQMRNAAIIANVGKGMHLSKRDILTGIVTAITESTLHNYAGGDGSSVGLFQQIDSWGSFAQRHNPEWAAHKFFASLKQVDGRKGMSIGEAAQAVQRSAYPGRYQTHVDEAKAILRAMAYSPGSTGPGGTAAPGATPRGQRAIDWATKQAHSATADWYYACLQFVRTAFGVGPRDKNATTGWLNARYKHRQTPGAAPAGVPLWWGGGDGHVALSLGNGNIISSDWPSAHDVGFAKAKDITQGWGKPYFGWTEDINGVKIYKHNAPGLLKGGTIRYDNTLINAHKNEKVLTAPLSQSLEKGIERMETHGGDTFNIEINVPAGEPVDADKLARKMMRAIEREKSRGGIDRWIK